MAWEICLSRVTGKGERDREPGRRNRPKGRSNAIAAKQDKKRNNNCFRLIKNTPRMETQYRIKLKGRPLEIPEFEFTSPVAIWSNKRNGDCPRSKWRLEHADRAKRGRGEVARGAPGGCAIVATRRISSSESRGRHPGETSDKLGKRFLGNEKTGLCDGARTRGCLSKRSI